MLESSTIELEGKPCSRYWRLGVRTFGIVQSWNDEHLKIENVKHLRLFWRVKTDLNTWHVCNLGIYWKMINSSIIGGSRLMGQGLAPNFSWAWALSNEPWGKSHELINESFDLVHGSGLGPGPGPSQWTIDNRLILLISRITLLMSRVMLFN